LRTTVACVTSFLHQRCHDPLDIRPLPDDQVVADLAGWLDQAAGIVAGVANSDQTCHLLVRVAVSWRKLVSVVEEQQEVDLIGAVRVGGVPLRLDFGRIVVQDVEDEVRLVLMGADDAGVAGDVVGDQGVRADALLQAEVFAAVPCVDGGDLCLDALAVAA
jgi:hypothetical protein